VSGIWSNKFEIALRPLRDRSGSQTVVVIETRTAAQATREATARFPEMKVVSVTRITPTVASIKAAQRAGSNYNSAQPEAEGQTSATPEAVVPIRRVS
jgi:hypothetical protein